MKTKYKFEEITGCTAFNFLINNRSLSEISEQEQEQILDYLLIKLKECVKENGIQLTNIVQLFQYDDYEYDDHVCEQCGDTVCTTTWNI
jgi:hypothetical protein